MSDSLTFVDQAVIVGLYLLLGWLWTIFWYNVVLDGKGWIDHPGKPGWFGLLGVTLIWLPMAFIVVLVIIVAFFVEGYFSDLLRKVYFLK